MSFRKPSHMPFRKLIPPFTLTAKVQSAKLNTDETTLMAGTEYFGETALQPRDHIPVNTMRKSHTFASMIRLSTTTHNLLTFKNTEISSNNSEKLSLLRDKHLWTFLLHSPYSGQFTDVESHGRRITLALFSDQNKTTSWPGSKFTCNFALT